MKRIYSVLICVLITLGAFLPQQAVAQAPGKISYQSVIRNSSDELVTNQEVGMQISILQGSASGTAVYVETHESTTNANGLLSLAIGEGAVQSGDFATIDWAAGPYFIKTETDPAGSTNYSITSISQMLSVPYAFHANTAQNLTGTIDETDPVFSAWDKSTGISITESQVSDLGNYILTESDPTFTENFNIIDPQDSDLLRYDAAIQKWVKVTPEILWQQNNNDIYFDQGNVAIGKTNPTSRFEVKGSENSADDEPLFQVINKHGDTVFAVYPERVQINIPEDSKGNNGGFAVSGRSVTKEYRDILKVTPDSTHIYINENTGSKGNIGGFAVSGRSVTKENTDILRVTPDNTHIYVSENSKGNIGGFAVSGRSATKSDTNFFFVNSDTTSITTPFYVNNTFNLGGNLVVQGTISSTPTITTTEVTNIDTASATSGGSIIDDGGDTVTSRGVVYGTSQNPTVTINEGITNDGSGTGTYASVLIGLNPSTTYYVRAYATNAAGTAYGNQVNFSTLAASSMPTVTTDQATNINTASATSGGNVIDDGGFAITERGVCWSISQNPTIADSKTNDGTGAGAFTSSITGLTETTTYYVRAYAMNSTGTAYGNQVSFTTLANDSTVVVVTNPTTGQTWMDRNLGASQAATSSTDELAYGDLYQWGRDTDGHQIRTSATTSTLSSGDNPGHGNFIVVGTNSPFDWRSPQNDNLWQGLSGINNPCPSGYRLPTEAEWEAERATWNTNDAVGAFDSPLKLPAAGYRYYTDGTLSSAGSIGYYWSSTAFSYYSWYIIFSSSNAGMINDSRAYGCSVRCIKN